MAVAACHPAHRPHQPPSFPAVATRCQNHPGLRMRMPCAAPSPFPGGSAPISEAPINFFRSAAHVSVKLAACHAGGSLSCQEQQRGDGAGISPLMSHRCTQAKPWPYSCPQLPWGGNEPLGSGSSHLAPLSRQSLPLPSGPTALSCGQVPALSSALPQDLLPGIWSGFGSLSSAPVPRLDPGVRSGARAWAEWECQAGAGAM